MTSRVAFTASEYQADGTIAHTAYELAGATPSGWEILRDGVLHLRLGSGYRLLRTSHCGVCATDLARRHLPFRLPQVTGHEVVATGDDGEPVVIEINASHAARDVTSSCAYCASGLASHCPDRLVLGIHDLPGGFGPWLLAPTAAVLPLPPAVGPRLGTFVEPFAAALHAARVATRVPRRRVAVLGPRRLGMLVVAALAVWRRRVGGQYEIIALARRAELRALARRLGADDARAPTDLDAAEVVIDTTGNPAGLEQALALARDEVHLKTTCGAPSAGLAQATAMVVDEVSLARDDAASLVPPAGGPPFETLLVLEGTPRGVRAALAARGLRLVDRSALATTPFGAADVVAVPSLAEVDTAIRLVAGLERGLVRPRGLIVVSGGAAGRQVLGDAVLGRGVMVTTSRCGDFRAALDLLPDVPALADALVTATFAAERLVEAFAAAADPGQLKVVVTQEGSAFG